MLALFFAVQIAAVQQPDVVVTARRFEDNLEACIARACPPAEEMDTALNASTQQFTEWRYLDSMRTMHRTIRRNRAHKADNPRRFAALHATLATAAAHEGQEDRQQRAVLAAHHVLATMSGAPARKRSRRVSRLSSWR